MGKRVYTINGNMYIIDDETGDILTIHIVNDQVPPKDMKDIIKLLAKNQKPEEDSVN